MEEQYKDLEELIEGYRRHGSEIEQQTLIVLLREVQGRFGCVSPASQKRIAEELDLRLPLVAALVRRIPGLREAASRHLIEVCGGPRCSGASPADGAALLKELGRLTGLSPGETGKDGRFSLSAVGCRKQCGTAPNLWIDGKHFPKAAPEGLEQILIRYR